MARHLIYTFLLLLFLQQVNGQSVKQYSFTHYSTSGGLASYEVTSITQDETGYMWIATNNGLQRFDGSRYLSFRKEKNNPNTLPNNVVTQVLMDHRNNLWVMTADGKIGIFDRSSFFYREVPVKGISDHAARTGSRQLIKDYEGHLFLLIHNQAFATLDETKMDFSPANNFIPIPADWKITSFAQQPGTKRYWFGRTNGLAIYDSRSSHFSYAGFNTEEEAIIYQMGDISSPAHIFFDRHDRVWFDSWVGSPRIYAFDLLKKKKVLDFNTLGSLINSYNEVGGFLQQRNGDIWLKGLGIFGKYLDDQKTFQKVYNGYENEQSIYYDGVNDFYEDRDENIWVATSNNGVYRFNPSEQYFINIPHINRKSKAKGIGSIMSFAHLRNGTMLAGSWGDGLYRYDQYNNVIPLNIKGIPEINFINIWSMAFSPDSNTIWMGGQPGIYAVDQRTNSSRYYNPSLLKDRTVRSVVTDRNGNLWMGMQNLGVMKWDVEKGKQKFDDGMSAYPLIPRDAQVMQMIRDSRGLVWVATSAHGTYVINPVSEQLVMHFGEQEPEERRLKWNSCIGLLEYDDTTMVIAANGLHLYNTRQHRIMKVVPLPESMPSEITAMQRDNSGYLWLSATSGIFRVNPKSDIFIHFDRVDGIANDRFVYAASSKFPDGRIVFGADNQIVMFDPDAVKINNMAPDITISGFKLGTRDLLVDSLLRRPQIDIPPGENSVSIEYAGLSFASAYIVMYKLEGIDHDWKRDQGNSQAVYTYLPPGTYTFLVKSEDAEGNSGKTVTRLKIVVHPYFYRTWWFYSLLVLLLLVILYGIDRERVKRMKDLQKMRSEIANNLHKDVTTTLSNINLLGEMAKIKADKDINRSKEYIDQISNKSHNMIIAMDDILWSIDPENDSMEKTLLRMMEFTDALKNRYGGNIELALDKKLRSLKPDMRTRNEFFLIFKEGLRLIVQYAGGRDTLVNIDLFRNRLSLKLQDATASLDTHVEQLEKSIRDINNRAKSIKAEADIQYDKNGMAVILLIPV